jgi:hypothetical protein
MYRMRYPGGAGKRERQNQVVLLKRLQTKGVPAEKKGLMPCLRRSWLMP